MLILDSAAVQNSYLVKISIIIIIFWLMPSVITNFLHLSTPFDLGFVNKENWVFGKLRYDKLRLGNCTLKKVSI